LEKFFRQGQGQGRCLFYLLPVFPHEGELIMVFLLSQIKLAIA
jgi:hypothetical protein